ncbi:tetrahydromethanopterin S-methyltransferase subunit G [Peribacillus simplex]|uniref:spore germination protein n=1 Tax=Peribacillus simplex TaxID=1478 RepID=UPI0024E24EBC|nr:spore germination protein [Peribacillus simplex]MDF9758994.1 tetrahydromethanopterin S-methyltransferase subunit G [Peribacillus simplex]
MRFFKGRKKTDAAAFQVTSKDFQELFKKFEASNDFLTFQFPNEDGYTISYFNSLVSEQQLHEEVLAVISNQTKKDLKQLKSDIPMEDMKVTTDINVIKRLVLAGSILIQNKKDDEMCLLIPCAHSVKRQTSIPESEYTVAGSKEAFVESLDTNLNLIRNRLPIPELQSKEFRVGSISQTRLVVLYIDGIVNQQIINTVMQRIDDIEYDTIVDISFVNQMIMDNRNSMFPQLIDTERPDHLASVLSEGKIGIMLDGSPHALVGPNTIISFFSSFEDYFQIWNLGTSFRLIRLFAVLFSVLSSPLYVAVLTYHYLVIPTDLLPILISSRGVIPFPPILEAIVLEGTIELLREAAVRLPAKVGSTIGIVGGIVIGTAAVEAGFVSNVLLMLVALAALASFTVPIYQISNTIRLIRFPFLIAAQLYGLFGLALCSAFILSHLLKLTSLGSPYLDPLYPLRIYDLNDSLIRLPFSKQTKRPQFLRTEKPLRIRRKEETNNSQSDIDE